MQQNARRALLSAPLLLFLCLGLWSRPVPRARAADPSVRLGKQEVNAEIDDGRGLAITTVRQEVINTGGDEGEASCDLPIPDEAALLRFQVLAPSPRRGERVTSRGRVAAIGRNLYRATIDHVPGHGRGLLELTYAEALTRRGRRRKYVYPILVAGDAAASQMSARVRIAARGVPEQVTCATHPMALRRPAPHVALLTYESRRPPDGRDLVVDYQLPDSLDDTRAHLSVLTPADSRQDPYFWLTLPPPAALLHGARALSQPADIVFCMDFSGSTTGRKLNIIQEAVHDGLADLAPHDRFGVVAFDDDARAFRRELVPADPGAVSAAIRFVNRLRPGGGTDPARGLGAALQLLGDRPTTRGRSAIIAVVIDEDDPADLARIATELRIERRGIRLVVLAARNDARLIDEQVHGKRLRPGPAVALSRAAVTFGPALSGAAFDPGPLNITYVYPPPERLPDLPLSTPVVLVGRLSQAPPTSGRVWLTGKIEGKTLSLPVDYTWRPLEPTSPVPALWANRRGRRLQQLARRAHASTGELSDAARRVQQEQGLVALPQP
jgi:Mg-chelatase subunit ChlD